MNENTPSDQGAPEEITIVEEAPEKPGVEMIETDEADKIQITTRLKVLIGILIFVVILGAGALYYYGNVFQKKAEKPVQKTAVATEPVSKEVTKDITWSDPKTIPALGIFAGDDGYGFNREAQAKYYSIGTYNTGKYRGGQLVLASAPFNGPSIYPGYYRLVSLNGTLSLLSKYSNDLSNDTTILTTKFTVDRETYIADLDYPETLQGPQPKQNLIFDSSVKDFFSLSNLKKVFTDSKYGDVYTTDVPNNVSSSSIFDKSGFYLKAPDGTVRVYYLNPDFIHDGFTDIGWLYNFNSDKYAVGDVAGCGRRNYATVVSADHMNNSKLSGHTNPSNDPVYDNTNQYELKDFYDNKYQGDMTKNPPVKVSFASFVASHPLVLWTDPFGRLIQLENTTFIFQGGCGKPVIYLYPTLTTKVSVKLDPKGGFTKSEPAYNKGWDVLADTFGNLLNLSDGKIYPYLFWEGFGNLYTSPDKGFVVAKNDVHSFLNDKLAKYGLNDKEIKDFEEFWEPRMTSSPYYFVSFWDNKEMDAIAPLAITPKPDTTIRVLMDYKPLDKPINVQGYQINTPARKGFTVVEWGGVLR